MIKLKDILKESTWTNRKFGEPLPTMADYKKLKEGGPGSGPHDDEDNPFDREPSDDEMSDIEKEFESVNEVSFPIRGKVSKSFEEYWRILLDLKIYHLNQAEREFPKYGKQFQKAKKLAAQLGDLVKKLSKVTK